MKPSRSCFSSMCTQIFGTLYAFQGIQIDRHWNREAWPVEIVLGETEYRQVKVPKRS